MEHKLYGQIGDQIQRLRHKRGMTQSELGDLLHLSRAAIANMEKGRQAIMLHTLYQITSKLRVDLNDLLPNYCVTTSRIPDDSPKKDLPRGFEEVSEHDQEWIKKRLAEFAQ